VSYGKAAERSYWPLLWLALPLACGESDATPAPPGAGCRATIEQAEACGGPSSALEFNEVQETWTTEPAPVFDGQPLVDGLYVQSARTLYCAQSYDPPPPLGSAATLLEVEGCVLRVLQRAADGSASISVVESFEYIAPGQLHVFVECPVQRDIAYGPYAFDGSTLQVPNSTRVEGPFGEPYDCLFVDTWQKR
jgi:hypothetical protein